MEKKRILVLNYEFPPLGGGGGVAAKTLSKGFIELGYDVDYVTTWFYGLKKQEIVDGINVHRVKVFGRKELPTATFISLISFPFLACKKAKELCKRNKYELINTHFAIPTGLLGIKIAKEFNIKHILSIHGGDIYDPTKKTSPHKKWYLRSAVKKSLNNSDAIAAQSTNTKENTIKYYHPNKEIKVIPLPYEPFKFKKVSRKYLKLKKDNIYLAGVGRLVKRKGFDFLIRSLSNIKNKKIHALIIGEGPEKENLTQLAKKLGIENRVHFLGAISEEQKFQYLSNSDIYVLSSVHEGFGIVLQEAMQAGIPIISTNNGGQTDIIKDKENGFLINYGDEKSLREKVELLVKDKDLVAKIKRNNKNKLNEFSLKIIAKKYLEILK